MAGLATLDGCAIQSSRVIFCAQLAERVAGKLKVHPESFDIFLVIRYHAAGLLNHLLLLANVLQQGSELQLNVGRGRFKWWGRLCKIDDNLSGRSEMFRSQRDAE